MKFLRVAVPVWILLFGFAFVAAPKSCEWGLSAYTWAGVIATLGLGALPVFVPKEMVTSRRVLIAVGLLLGTVAVWLGGLFAANVRLMCRLF